MDERLYRERGIHITRLKSHKSFEYMMFDEPKQKASCIANRQLLGVPCKGTAGPASAYAGAPGSSKRTLISREVNRLRRDRPCVQYIGIAADEAKRCKTDNGKSYPLVDWGITEAEALQICYDRGFRFGGLYEVYDRASCWCCPFQSIGELRKLRSHHPSFAARLLDMDSRALAQFGGTPLGRFTKNWSVAELGERFAREEEGVTGV